MKLTALLIPLSWFSLPALASLPVPGDLRNPFEPANAAPVRPPVRAPVPEAPKPVEPARPTQEPIFARVEQRLRQLPVKGVIANRSDPSANTALVGNYIIRPNTSLPTQDFGFSGLMKVVEVTQTHMTLEVSIGLETRPLTIPLTR